MIRKNGSLSGAPALLFAPAILILLALAAHANAQEAGSTPQAASAARGLAIVLDAERRSIIREVDGYALLGEGITRARAREAAFAEAKRRALESARTAIRSMTRVAGGVLDYEIIKTSAHGQVRILAERDHGLDDQGRHHVWIRAEVAFGLRPTPEQAPLLASPEAPLTVRVWTDEKSYREGERIQIRLWGNRDFYARVVNEMADGAVVQLLPNRYRQDAFFQGGVEHRMPNGALGDRFQVEVVPPFGVERVIVYASERPLGEVALQPVAMGLGLYQGSIKALGEASRGLAIVPGDGDAGAQFQEAVWSFRTDR